MSEAGLGHELLERLTRIETKIEVLATAERMAIVEASSKQAHRRIDDLEELHAYDQKEAKEALEKTEKRIYWTAGVVFTVAQIIINFFMRQ